MGVTLIYTPPGSYLFHMILLTGATGFIGRNLLEKLTAIDKVRCLVRNKEKAEELERQGYETGVWNMGDRQIPSGVLRGVDVVIHAAAQMRGKAKDFREVNVAGTKQLIETCKKEQVRQIIFLSSILAADGYHNEYGKSKREGEEYIRRSMIDYTILRIGNVYGSNDQRTFEKLIWLIEKMPFLVVFGKEGVNTNFVHIKDVTKAIVNAVKNQKSKNKTYYLVGEKLSYKDFFVLMSRKMNKKKLIITLPAAPARLALSLYQSTVGRHIKLPVHPDPMIISREFSTEDAEMDLGFHKSTNDTLLRTARLVLSNEKK